MDLKYTEKATKNQDNNSVNMLLYGEIDGNDFRSVNSVDFVREMEYHNRNDRHIVVKINSEGGSVFGGYAIQNAIEETQSDTYIVGLAASMGGVIAQSGKKRIANHRATLMIHPPKNGSKDLLNIVTKTLKTDLTEKSSLSEEEVLSIMNGDKDVWFDAETAYAKGLIDSLIKSGEKLTTVVNKSSSELYAAYDGLLSNNSKKSKTMKNVLNQLELPENKTEADVINAVKNLQTLASKASDLEVSNTALLAENKTLKENAENELKSKATDLVNLAVKEGKVSEESKEAWVNQAVTNYDLAAQTLGSLSKEVKKATSVTNLTDKEKGDNGEAKDYKFLAENEPEVLNKMITDEPEKYQKLVNEFHSK